MATQEKNYRDVGKISDSELCLMSGEELESFFLTDAEQGLTAREADSRIKRSVSGKLFGVKTKSTLQCMRDMLAYPMLWLLLALALVAVLFDKVLLGASVAAIALGEGIFLAFIARKQQLLSADVQRMDAPAARVLRGGKLYRIPEEGLAVGDILLLFEGDIVPADLRLLYADGLEVEEYITSQRVLLKKSASALTQPPSKGTLDSPENIIYAGDTVCGGVGVGVVYALGSDTHVGAKDGEIRPIHRADSSKKRSSVAASVEDFFSLYSLVSSVAIIPLIIIGLLTLGSKSDLINIVMTAAALCAATVGTRALVLVTYNHTVCARGLSRLGQSGTSSLVKSEKTVDALGKATDIIAIGGASLHDGIPHPEQVMIGQNIYDLNELDSSVELTEFSEYLYLISKYADFSSSTLPYSDIKLLTQLNPVSPDRDSLALRIEGIASVKNGVRVMYKNGESQLLIMTDSFSTFKKGIADASLLGEYTAFRSNACDSGMEILYILAGNGSTPVGAIAYARHTSARTHGAVSTLEDRTVRVFAFDLSDTPTVVRAMRECGFTDIVRPDSSISELADSGKRAFVGVPNESIADFIRDLKDRGRTVVVIAHSLEDANLLNMADVAVAVTPDCAESARRLASGEENPDSMPNGKRTCDLMLRRADLLIGRATETGGGLLSILRAHTSAMRADRKLFASLKYLIVSMAARILLTVLTLIFGLSLMSSITLLLSSMVFDAVAMLSIALAGDANVQTDAHGEETSFKKRSPKKLILCAKSELTALLLGIAVYALVLLLAFAIGLAGLSELTCASGIALLMLQLAVYISLVRWRTKGERGTRLSVSRASVFLTVLLVLTICTALVVYRSVGVQLLPIVFAAALPIGYAVFAKLLKKIHNR